MQKMKLRCNIKTKEGELIGEAGDEVIVESSGVKVSIVRIRKNSRRVLVAKENLV